MIQPHGGPARPALYGGRDSLRVLPAIAPYRIAAGPLPAAPRSSHAPCWIGFTARAAAMRRACGAWCANVGCGVPAPLERRLPASVEKGGHGSPPGRPMVVPPATPGSTPGRPRAGYLWSRNLTRRTTCQIAQAILHAGNLSRRMACQIAPSFLCPHPPRMKMNTAENPSQIRRTLDSRLKQLKPRGPVLLASLVQSARKCGRYGCKCNRGGGSGSGPRRDRTRPKRRST